MSLRITGRRLASFGALVVFSGCGSFAAEVLTAQYNNARTAANLEETRLTTANVGAKTFGKLFSRAVDSSICAQPLIAERVPLPAGPANVVYVTTIRNKVYAFDAEDPAAEKPLWSVQLDPPDAFSEGGSPLGILATPVISRDTQAIYVVTTTSIDRRRAFRLHALDLVTGQEKFDGPVTVGGEVPGKGSEAVDGVLKFTGRRHLVRTGLAISGNTVYFATASARDESPSHGWIFGYDIKTLRRVAIFSDTTGGLLGGIWQSGRAPAVDDKGFLYFETGNGDYDGKTNFGQSILKLSTQDGLSVVDWFTPDYWQQLNEYDWDVGSTGPVLIPGTDFVIGGSKSGIFYLLRQQNMGKLQRNNRQIAESFLGTKECWLRNAGGCAAITNQVFWNHESKPALYVWGVSDRLRVFSFTGEKFNVKPVGVSAQSAGYPGGMLTISSNGSKPGTGILWSATTGKDGSLTLRAFDALDVETELWSSFDNSERDGAGRAVDFVAPVVVNGKVYLATDSKRLVVYGLLP
jgi:hypothetical protein